jgi:hypothetical protein
MGELRLASAAGERRMSIERGDRLPDIRELPALPATARPVTLSRRQTIAELIEYCERHGVDLRYRSRERRFYEVPLKDAK